MDKKYYLRNLILGIVWFCVFIYAYNFSSTIAKPNSEVLSYSTILGLNAFFFPLSKRMIENIIFRHTTSEFRSKNIFIESLWNRGFYVLFYLLLFIFSIPFGSLFLVSLYIKKQRRS